MTYMFMIGLMFILIIDCAEAHFDNMPPGQSGRPYMEDGGYVFAWLLTGVNILEPVSLIHLDFHDSHVTQGGNLGPEAGVNFSGTFVNQQQGSILDPQNKFQ